jgi:cytochrome c-type biogenesis protein CcmF
LIAELGHFALALALILAFAQMVLTLWGAETRNARLMAAGPPLATGGCIAIAASFACLMYSYVINDTTC